MFERVGGKKIKSFPFGDARPEYIISPHTRNNKNALTGISAHVSRCGPSGLQFNTIHCKSICKQIFRCSVSACCLLSDFVEIKTLYRRGGRKQAGDAALPAEMNKRIMWRIMRTCFGSQKWRERAVLKPKQEHPLFGTSISHTQYTDLLLCGHVMQSRKTRRVCARRAGGSRRKRERGACSKKNVTRLHL